MSWDMGYYGGNDGYGADDDGYDFEEPPQQQRAAPRSPGLRSHMRAITAENKALKKELEEQKAALAELMEGDTSIQPQAAGYQHPRSPLLTPEEIANYQRMVNTGAVQAAAPAGTEAELVSRIRNAESPDALMEVLRSQGNTMGTANYNGMGY